MTNSTKNITIKVIIKPKDDFTSKQINMPVYTISRKGIWKITPEGKITQEEGPKWYKNIEKKGCPCN